MSRQGVLGPFLLEGPSGELARAVKVSAFRQQFTLTVGEREYTLRRLSWWRREFGLFYGGASVGSVAPESWFSRRAQVFLPEDLPGGVRAFVVWLTVLMWKRDAETAASSS